MNFYKFGPLLVDMQGDQRLISALAQDFESYRTLDAGDADLRIQITEQSPPFIADFYIGKGRNAFGDRCIYIDKSPYFSYVIEGLFEKEAPTIFTLILKRPGWTRRSIDTLKGLLGVEYSNRYKLLRMLVANYSLLWSVIAITLLKKDVAFVHAGAVSRDGGITLIAGTGGGGKTSATMQLIERAGTFVSEDFGMLGADGRVYYSPKAISFYESDLRWGGATSTWVKQSFNTPDRLRWWVLVRLLRRNPLVKVPPQIMFPQTLAEGVVGKAVYLRRLSGENIKGEVIDAEQFAERASWASLREMMPFLEVLCRVQANMEHSRTFLGPEDIRLRMKEIFTTGLAQAQVRLISAPFKATPKSVCDAIESSEVGVD
jgi:hypothetical protein